MKKKYLPMLFEDILNQTYPLQNIEVVLMDSNSTDNTRKLMEEFKNNNESFKCSNRYKRTSNSGSRV